ncbi:MAG: hypothetical protein IBX61_04460 [Thermoleophilia bacterium]|nr:hypothetical protein [Thermoleophilia bacterium]
MKKAVIATLVFLVIVTLPFIVNAAQGNIGKVETKADLEERINQNPEELEKRDGETRCVEETEYMRVNHMKILKEERVNYVRYGEINEQHSIKGCFTCHDYENFCAECHKYNGVKPGCMTENGGCHSTDQPDYPRPEV